jgi:hypothetical protein
MATFMSWNWINYGGARIFFLHTKILGPTFWNLFLVFMTSIHEGIMCSSYWTHILVFFKEMLIDNYDINFFKIKPNISYIKNSKC